MPDYLGYACCENRGSVPGFFGFLQIDITVGRGILLDHAAGGAAGLVADKEDIGAGLAR